MAGNSYFSEDLGGGYSMNIQTGEILNSNNGQVYPNADALRQGAATMSAQPQSQGGGGQSGAGGVGGGISSGLAGYQLYNQALTQGGSQALAQGGGQALSQGGSQAVGSAMNGGTMLADGTIQGGTQAAGGVGSSLASAAPYAAVAAWLYDQYETAPGKFNAGANYDPKIAGWKSVSNDWKDNKNLLDYAKFAYDAYTGQMAANAYYATAGSLFGSKRKIDRDYRKSYRKGIQDAGLMGKDSRSIYSLPDGTGFDIREFKKNTGGDAYNIDFNDPNLNNDRVGFIDAMSASILGGKDGRQGKARSDITGEMYNAYNSNGRIDENSRMAGDKLGGRNALYQGILDQWGNKQLTADQRDNYLAAIDKEYGIANPTNARWDSQLTGKDAERNQKEFAEAEKKRQEQAAKNPQAKPMATNMPVNAKPFPFSPPVKPVAQNQSINPRLKGRR